MAKVRTEKRTIIIIPEDPEEFAACNTFDRKWINKFEKHVEEGHAEEVESSVAGAREFEFERSMLRIPFYRKPREWTEDQKEEARERLAGVREAVAKQRLKTKKAATKATTAKGKKAAPVAKKPAAEPNPIDGIAAAQAERIEREALKRERPCSECNGDRMVDTGDGLDQCERCDASGVDPVQEAS